MKRILNLLLLLGVSFTQAQESISDFLEKTKGEETIFKDFRWMGKGESYALLSEGSILKYNTLTGLITDTLFYKPDHSLEIEDYQFSSNEQMILLLTDKRTLISESFDGEYFLFDIKANSIKPLSDARQSYATFSPDGNAIAYVVENNLHVLEFKSGANYPITNHAPEEYTKSGSADRQYELAFGMTRAFEWSPDSKKIAFLTFDQSDVEDYQPTDWSDFKPNYKYSTAGGEIPKVTVSIFDITTNKLTRVKLTGDSYYVPLIHWTYDPNLLGVVKMSRDQKRQDIFHAYANSGSLKPILTDKTKKYIDFNYLNTLVYLKSGTHFILSSDREGNKHFGLHNMEGQLVGKTTSGGFEATKVVGLDQRGKREILYYLSTEVSPLERHLYRVGVDGKLKKRLTLDSGYYDFIPSPDFQYFLQQKSTSKNRKAYSIISSKGFDTLRVLHRAPEIENTFAEKHFFNFPGHDNTTLNGYLLKPIDFDSAKSYPLLIYQNSAPGTQEVLNKWEDDHHYFNQYLVKKGYLVAVIDVRGTGGRGADFEKSTYGKLGILETQDVIKAAQFLGSREFIDLSRIGIWGWGYGGFVAIQSLSKGNGIFKMGIAIAPITDWNIHQAAYTEKYLGLPGTNRNGYALSSAINEVDNFKGKFLLVHGLKDEEVHFEHSKKLHQALLKAGKEFETFYYPEEGHNFRTQKGHLYNKLFKFIERSL